MPIKSKAQRRKFAELLVEGKITPETFEEWNRGAGSKELPERLHPERKPKRKARKKRPRRRRGQEDDAKDGGARAAAMIRATCPRSKPLVAESRATDTSPRSERARRGGERPGTTRFLGFPARSGTGSALHVPRETGWAA